MVRVVVADDHRLFREALRTILDAEGFVVEGEADDGEQAVELCGRLQPDVALLDLSMPRLTGLEVLPRLRQVSPRTSAILLTARIDRRETIDALRAGARGIVLKSADTEVLVGALREVASGGLWVGHKTVSDLMAALGELEHPAEALAAPPPRLTVRELQIVSAVVDGASNADIGEQFGMRSQTVKNHLTTIFHKVGVSTRVELALFAISRGLIDSARPPARA